MDIETLQFIFLVTAGIAIIAAIIVAVANYFEKRVQRKGISTEKMAIDLEPIKHQVKNESVRQLIDEQIVGRPVDKEAHNTSIENRSIPKIQKKFGALRLIVVIIKMIAIFTSIGGYVFSGTLLSGPSTGINFFDPIPMGLIGIVASTLIGVLIYSYADFIQCMVDIEHNTRQITINTIRDAS